MEGNTRILEFFGITVSAEVFNSLLATLIISVLAIVWMTRNLSVENPSKPQLVLEWIYNFVKGIVGGSIHSPRAQRFQLLGMTLLILIFAANMIGLPLLLTIGGYTMWTSPTGDVSVAFTIALMVIILSHMLGVERQGTKGYFVKSYLEPLSALAPINLIEEFTNSLTLALRLYGNIFAGGVLLGIIADFATSYQPWTWVVGIPLQMVWQGFSGFLGAIQAYIFVTLAMVYMANKVEN